MTSLGPDFFERMYATTVDPWRFATSEYEAQKYRATLAALPAARYSRAFEIGCSIGVLTAQLALRCGSLLSVDVNDRALAEAERRCANLPNVRFERMSVPERFPTGTFDLIVLSEVGYYWSPSDLQSAIDRIATAAAGGVVELVHFLPNVEEYPSDGDSVHRAFLEDSRFAPIVTRRAERYRIDVLRAR